MKHETLQAKLDALPRVRLAHLPTPLEPCPRLSAALAGPGGGPQIWVKRDDLTGLAFGGNKTRQLEFVFAELLARGADTLVIGAYTQSNWCRQATAAAMKLGLDVALVLLHGEKGPRLQGNLLLDRLMGADVTVVDLDSMEKLQPHLDAKADSLSAAGRKPYVVAPLGVESLSLGALGYVGAALEMDAQCTAAGLDPAHLYLCGANMTPAGLALGFEALGRRVHIRNVAPIRWTMPRDEDIARIAEATARRLDLDVRIDKSVIDNTDAFIGERYGVVTEEGLEALKLAARTEALILDPVYSSKAMAALVADVRDGKITADEPVVFLHTGGNPALFAYAEDLDLE
ncbi:MAG: D-cysteine desulfhydrase family protein [Geminicoccaceae bacterium]|nr:D-cysteine desulfhydrase family protein [Geminicoccaceae bacterium]